MAKTQNNELEWYWWVIIVLIAIIAILLFVGSFGTVDINSGNNKPAKPKFTNQEILIKHEKLLKALIEKREKIYKKRKQIYSIVYFSIRFILIGAWMLGNVMLYYKFGVIELGTIIDYNNALFILIFVFIFLFWGKISTMQNLISLFEKRLEI